MLSCIGLRVRLLTCLSIVEYMSLEIPGNNIDGSYCVLHLLVCDDEV